MNLLDQIIKSEKELEGKNCRLAALDQSIADAETTLRARHQELTQLERTSSQRIKSEQTTWDRQQRDDTKALLIRLADVQARETALKDFPQQAEALELRERTVGKREKEATAQWQQAKQAELDWQERDKELDAKAAAIEERKSKAR